MEIRFIAGFGPIAADSDHSRRFWADTLGLPFEEIAPSYFHSSRIEGAKAFDIWPLSQAAESTFGTKRWPEGIPVPQAWIELDVASADAVAVAASELIEHGHAVLKPASEEPWGQWTTRLLSPEGLLVGISWTPWMHAVDESENGEAER